MNTAVSLAVEEFTTQSYAGAAELQKSPDYNHKISAIRENLAAIPPDRFKKMNISVQKEVLKNLNKTDIPIFPYVCFETQKTLFENQFYRTQIAKGLCKWNENKTSLRIADNSLTHDQIGHMLLEMAPEEKSNAETLDLSSCIALESLALDNRSILEGFDRLTTLILPNWTFFAEPKGINAVCNHLETLDISGSGVESLEFLEGFSSLKVFKANRCGKLKDVAGLKHCPELTELVLTGCSQVHQSKFSVIATLANLERCNMHNTVSLNSLEPFKELRKLTQLDISGTRVPQKECLSSKVSITR